MTGLSAFGVMSAFAFPCPWISGHSENSSAILARRLAKYRSGRSSFSVPEKPFPAAILGVGPSEPSENKGQGKTGFNKTRTIIVPGKFDAFHIGHRELARAAVKMGSPMLLSFSGMAEALRWPPRAPVVAAVERDRILRSWSVSIGEQVGWRVLPFPEIRDQSPEEFLEMLCTRFMAKGVVCGRDWRFGHRAVGDVELLKELAPRLGLEVQVVDGVEDGDGEGVVSSTRVRKALGSGRVEEAARLLGRPHRLVGYVGSLGEGLVNCDRFVNQVPGDGEYRASVRVIGRSEPFSAGVRVKRRQAMNPLGAVRGLEVSESVLVQIRDAERIYCADCEVYLDFMEQISLSVID